MNIVLLTGSRYSGEDFIVDQFQKRDVPVFDADIAYKFLINFNSKVIDKIKGELGNDVYDKHNMLDEFKITKNNEVRKALKICNDELLRLFFQWVRKKNNPKIIIFKNLCNIEFGEDSLDLFDKTVLIDYNNDEERIETYNNILKTNKYIPKEDNPHKYADIHKIIKYELKAKNKINNCDYIINTSRSKTTIENRIDWIISVITKK